MFRLSAQALRQVHLEHPKKSQTLNASAHYFRFFEKKMMSSWFPKEALPILPLVSLPHKWITAALASTRDQLPCEFVKELQEKLDQIRKIPWNGLEEFPLYPDAPSYRQGKLLLEEFLSFESKLPGPLSEALSKIAERNVQDVFDSLRTGIKHLEFHREHKDFEALRNNRR